MAQPATDPVWNTSGANRTPPSAGQQDSGWTVSQIPPSSFFNWWQFWVYQWILYLKNLTGEVLTWTAQHLFNAKVTMKAGLAVDSSLSAFTDNDGVGAVGKGAGNGVSGSSTNNAASSGVIGYQVGAGLSAVSGIGTNSTSNGTGGYFVGGKYAVFAWPSAAGSYALYANGRNDGWGGKFLGATAIEAESITPGGSGLSVKSAAGGGGQAILAVGQATNGVAISATGGPSTPSIITVGGAGSDGIRAFGGAGSGYAGDFVAGTGSVSPAARFRRVDSSTYLPSIEVNAPIDLDTAPLPSPTQALKNRLTRMNFAKAQGTVTLNNSASPVISAVQNATVTGTATSVTVTFAQPMVGEYEIFHTLENLQVYPYYASVTAKSTAGFTISLYKWTVSGANLVNTAPVGTEASGIKVTFAVLGDQ